MSGNEANGDHDQGAVGSGGESTSTPGTTAPPQQGQPSVTVNGNGMTFIGMDIGGQSVGRNGIQMKWPEHPGEYGLTGAGTHTRWKNYIKTVMRIKGIDDADCCSSHNDVRAESRQKYIGAH